MWVIMIMIKLQPSLSSFSPLISVHGSDKDSLFEILTLSDDNNSGQGQVVLRSNTADGGQSLSARKLGAISSSGRAVSEVEQPASTDLFRLLLVNRPSIVFLSVLTGGFISRGKQTSLDCSNTTYEPFFLRQTKQNTYQFFARKLILYLTIIAIIIITGNNIVLVTIIPLQPNSCLVLSVTSIPFLTGWVN